MERREWSIDLDEESRIAISTKGRPLKRYVVRLELRIHDGWQTIHLFDNAHGRNDEHEYVGAVKQGATEFFFGPPTGALPTAIGLLKSHAPAIIARWRQRAR